LKWEKDLHNIIGGIIFEEVYQARSEALGGIGSVSEVIRSALRLLEKKKKRKNKSLLKALQWREQSGFVGRFNPDETSEKEIHRQHK